MSERLYVVKYGEPRHRTRYRDAVLLGTFSDRKAAEAHAREHRGRVLTERAYDAFERIRQADKTG